MFKIISLTFPPTSTNTIRPEQNDQEHPIPKPKELVSKFTLFLLCGIMPIICFLIADWWSVYPCDSLSRCCSLFLAIGLTGGFTDLLKLCFPRERPNYDKMVDFDPKDAMMSFPSGHSSLASTSMLQISLCLVEKNAPYWLTFCPMFVAFLVAWTRVHDEWHYPVDVCVGAVIGIASVIITYQIWYVIQCDIG